MNARELGEQAAHPLMPPLDAAGNTASGYPYPESGLTKREAFAMAAMQGILANPMRCSPSAADHVDPEVMASLLGKASLEFADGLLAELAKDGDA